MNIARGWAFHSADFSLQAAGSRDTGSVMLVRGPCERIRWHNMSDELKDDDHGPELYVHGYGMSIEDAVIDANYSAAHAKPIPDLTNPDE